jgi:cold shock protein
MNCSINARQVIISNVYFSLPNLACQENIILAKCVITRIVIQHYLQQGFYLSRKMTGIVKTFDYHSGKGLIIPSDGRKDVQVHISALSSHDPEALIPGIRVEFCRVNGLRGPTAANVYLS